jgi:hypothetical protein
MIDVFCQRGEQGDVEMGSLVLVYSYQKIIKRMIYQIISNQCQNWESL